MSYYYDKSGKPITLTEWAVLMEELEYRRVALDELPDGKRVSTVWLGLDYSFNGNGEQPLIFETMVFPNPSGKPKDLKDWNELECERYSTLKDALAGHILLVQKYTNYGN